MNPSQLPASIKAGDRIGDYEILQILGQGGMGAVYKVRNVISERIEAMKVLLPNLEGDAGLADRFLREIKVQAALDHPNIAKLNTATQVGNQIVMILEFVDGTSVEQLLQKGSIPVSDAVSYTRQVLDALAYAHQHGVVHRDIKPANIMVTGNGTVKLMDFGIARMKADQRLTNAGGTVGSLLYMSPEQIKGVELDGRADIYSLGITLYEMVTGRRPFAADSDFQLMSAHLMQAPVAPMEVIPGVPQDLNDIILMAIAKEPENRFQSGLAFRGALSSIGSEPQQPMPAQPFGTPTRTLERPAVAATGRPATVFEAPMAAPVSPPSMPSAMPPPMTAPAMPPPSAQSNRRGLYMALGSLATLAVLIFAMIEGSKLIRGGNTGAASTTTTAPVPNIPPGTTTPAPTNGSRVQVQTPRVPDAGKGTPQTPTADASTTPPPDSVPGNSSPKDVPPRRTNVTPSDIVIPSLRPPSQRAQNQAVPDPAIPNQTPQPGPPRPVSSPELNEVRERYNQLAVKASALKDGVNVMQQNLARQGLGLRTEVMQARAGLDYQMQEAMQAIRSGDVEAARQSLTYAEGNAAKLARFLGQ